MYQSIDYMIFFTQALYLDGEIGDGYHTLSMATFCARDLVSSHQEADLYTPGLETAMLDMPLSVRSCVGFNIPIQLLNLEM